MQQPRDFSLYGAVDLGARQAAAQRRQQAAARNAEASEPGAADEASAYVIDVTEENFSNEVALRSRTTPVVIDLWADWCEPCKQLSPVLEKLANEAAGAWVLAKIDVDANQRLAAQFFQMLQTQSIPLVVAIVDGQPISAFPGAIPEAQIRQWLAQVLALAEQLGIGSPDGASGAEEADAMPPAYAEAQEAMQRGDLDAAAGVLEKTLAEAPADPIAKSLLAQVNLIRRVNSYDQAAARREAAASPGDVQAQLKVADIELAAGRHDQAFDRLLGVIKRTTGEERNDARVHLLDLFEIFGPDEPEVKKARARLTSLLF